jgi:lysophospholipase L1-like esterase
MTQKTLFISLITVQIVVIGFLSIKIIQNKKNIFGESFVNTIPKNSIRFFSTDNLKYFYEPKPNSVQKIIKDWLPYSPKYTFNKDTFNERFDYSVEKSNRTYRIITLGDSFTFGQNVSTDRNWSELLENELNKKLSCKNIKKFEVINLGVYGYDAQYAVGRFSLRGTKYNPDLVIWTFTDFERILEKMWPYIEEHKQEAENLEKKGIYYQNWNDARENLKKEIGTDGFVNDLKEQLEKFNGIYKKKLLLTVLPNYQIYIDTLKKFSSQRSNTHFFQPSIKWEEKQYFLPDSHLNDFGHQKIAEDVYDYLTKNKLIPCN